MFQTWSAEKILTKWKIETKTQKLQIAFHKI